MSLTKYFLSLSMLLGLGLAANAQDWGTPTGTTGQASDKDDKDRYVTSVTTTGATEDLSYSNGSLPSSVYVYTGEGMTVERGQTVTLHVTTSEDMIWCAGMTYVDWNLDYDFDDEGESYPKVGLEVNDDGSSNLPYSGNPGIVDYTVELTVPENAALGTTRLRLQYQDAWHNPPKGHSHSAMDAVDKGGVYDFDVTITEAAAPVEGPTLVIGEHTNGQILVYTTDGEGVQTFYENGETLPLGWITAQFVADDGYTLQTPYFGSMDLTGSLEADNTFSIEVVEGTETVSFSAVFVEEAVEPEPSGWTIVAEHTMSGTSRQEVVEAIMDQGVERTIIATNFGSVNNSPTSSGVALIEGLPYCWGVGSTMSNDYVGYTVAVEETGTYKFSFQSRLDQDKGASTDNATVELRYVENGGNLSYESAVSTSQTLPATTALPGTLLESNELELTAGTSYDFVVYVTSASSSSSRLFVGDFKLYKKGAAPENYEVTWTAPENGTLTIMNGDVELTSGALVAEGTELTVIAAPAFGYQLDAVTVNDETLEGTTFTVTGATVVAATFVPVQLEEWPHDTTGQAANGNPSVHPSEDRYVTSATTTGAAIDLNWTNSERPSTWYINTGAMMQAEQGTTFDLRMQSSEDMIWCHAVIFVDWNGDKDFDDEGEMIAKVGLDHVDDGAGGSFFQTGNPDLVDFTQTIEVPATATVGTTCIRVMYTDAWHDTNKGHSHSAMDAVDKGGIYDFYIDITEGEIVNTLTVEAEHATVLVRDYNTLEEYSAGTVLETGTQLLVSAEAEAGYEVTSVTVNGEEWPSYEPYTVDGPVHVVATAEALPMVTVNYTFEGEEYGSMTVYDVSGWTMEPIENGGSVEVGGAVNVMVTMNDNVEGTITVNGGEPVEFNSTTWEGLYTQRIDITEDMETLDIAVVLTEAKAPENFYDFTYTIEGEELLDEITIGDAMTGEPIESGASLGEGTRVGVLIYYAEGVDLTITINDVEQDIADNVVIMDGKCMYYGEITMDQDINLGIVLSQGTEPEGHTVTYALTGEAASAGTVYVNDMTDLSKLESGDTVADGADVNVQVTFDDQTVVGEMFVNGVSVGTFEYADNAGLYNYVVENVTADIDIEIELSYGNGIDSNLADGLKVYPTVFDEAVTVETPVDGSVTVYDMSGAAVYTAEVFEGSNSLPLGSLADGHYTLRVEGAGQSATVRVVKK